MTALATLSFVEPDAPDGRRDEPRPGQLFDSLCLARRRGDHRHAVALIEEIRRRCDVSVAFVNPARRAGGRP